MNLTDALVLRSLPPIRIPEDIVEPEWKLNFIPELEDLNHEVKELQHLVLDDLIEAADYYTDAGIQFVKNEYEYIYFKLNNLIYRIEMDFEGHDTTPCEGALRYQDSPKAQADIIHGIKRLIEMELMSHDLL